MPRMNWTIDDHRRASLVLKEIQGCLREFARPPLNQMPCRISKYVDRIELAIMQMRAELEDQMFLSLRDHPEVSTHVYYPKHEEGQE